MNEVEEYYLQHFGVKGMKWGVRKKRGSGTTRQQKKAQKQLTKEARKDYRKYKKVDKDWTPYERAAQVRKINDKKRNVKGYNEAFEKGSKQVDRTDKIVGTTASIASKAFIAREAMRITNPQAYMKATRVVDSAVKGTGQYAKYAARSVTPSRYTVKARDIIDAAMVN